jgi:hypothetical protein
MTEEEWLSATDPVPMFENLKGKKSDRKERLFVVACARLKSERKHFFDDETDLPEDYDKLLQSIDLAEDYADGNVGDKERQAGLRNLGPGYVGRFSCMILYSLPSPSDELSCEFIAKTYRSTSREQASYIREIFGNPFRPITLDPSWLTSTVVALARQIYASRDFSAMPILADALQDAGCDNEDILNHCLQPREHVRGCWALDLVLGKS